MFFTLAPVVYLSLDTVENLQMMNGAQIVRGKVSNQWRTKSNATYYLHPTNPYPYIQTMTPKSRPTWNYHYTYCMIVIQTWWGRQSNSNRSDIPCFLYIIHPQEAIKLSELLAQIQLEASEKGWRAVVYILPKFLNVSLSYESLICSFPVVVTHLYLNFRWEML